MTGKSSGWVLRGEEVIGDNNTNYSYLNREGDWPHFKLSGVEIRSDGALQLNSLPLLEGAMPIELIEAAEPDGPAGIAVDLDGTIYFSDPTKNLVFEIDGCDGKTAPLSCMGGNGTEPPRFESPRGLLIPHHRRTLFVADSGNHRLQLFDLATLQLVEVWGQESVSGAVPGTQPGHFDSPVALAGDEDGNVYVVDYGNRRVQKFDAAGQVVRGFWDAARNSAVLSKPIGIAVWGQGKETRVYIVDEEKHAVFLFDREGKPVRDDSGRTVSFGGDQLKRPMGITATSDALYVGDNELRNVLKFRSRDQAYSGNAVGYQGPVAALTVNGKGSLLVHPGGSYELIRLVEDGGYLSRGVIWSETISLRDYEVSWHRLLAVIEELGPAAHLKLFIFTSNDPASPPAVDPSAADPFEDPSWRPHLEAPNQYADLVDLFIGGSPARYLWVGALFWSDGRSTPVVTQMRVEFDHQTYLEHLPAIYDAESTCGDLLLRLLSLLEAMFGAVESETANLSRLFDVDAVPREFLGWLAGWLALDLNEDWDDAKKRDLIRRAFSLYSRRGTVEGLRESLRLFAGVDVIIEEPIINAAWWALPATEQPCGCGGARDGCSCGSSTGSTTRSGCECGCKSLTKKTSGDCADSAGEVSWTSTECSILGVTTMLAPAQPQGAVMGTTATLDRSDLIDGDEFGSPLFTDVAYQFTVQVYRGQLRCADSLTRVRTVLQREKPAHAAYHLCVIEPLFRAGYQARVGIDAVVAGPQQSFAFGAGLLGEDTTLAGQPSARVGEDSRLGITTRVG